MAKVTTQDLLFIDSISLILEIIIYLLSFLLPMRLLWAVKNDSYIIVLLVMMLGWFIAIVVFVTIIVLIKKVFIGEIPAGKFALTGNPTIRWIAAQRCIRITNRSPFIQVVYDFMPFRLYFLRGMGAQIGSNLLLNGKISEPWAVKIGDNVVIGEDAIIVGHKIENDIVTIGNIEIGDNALIGGRSIIFPGVKIGEGAIIGANSLVTAGAQVPAGEIWVGTPARKKEVHKH